MGLLKIVLILSLHVVGVSCDEQINVNICQTKGTTNCGDCIAISEVCGWCLQENFTDTATARCDTTDRLQQKGCDKENILIPIIKRQSLRTSHWPTGTTTHRLCSCNLNTLKSSSDEINLINSTSPTEWQKTSQ
ncbi:hypothetical protein ScPMuIL_015870 [Solemya velum]